MALQIRDWKVYAIPIIIALVFSMRELFLNRSYWIDESYSFFQMLMPLEQWIAVYPFLFLMSIIFLAVSGYLLVTDFSFEDKEAKFWRQILASMIFVVGAISVYASNINPKDVHPPLYYLLLKGWALLVGLSTYALRSLSVLFFILSVIALVYYCRKYYGDRVAVIAGIIFAFSSTFVHFATEARMYSILIFFAIISFIKFRELIDNPFCSKKDMIWYYTFTIALPFLHYFGLLFIACEMCIYLWMRKSLKKLAKLFLPIILACIPLAIFFLLQMLRISNVGLGFPNPTAYSWISSISFALNYLQHLVIAEGIVNFVLFVVAVLILFLMALFVAKRGGKWSFIELSMVTIPQMLGIVIVGIILNKYLPRYFLMFLWLVPVLLAQVIDFVITRRKWIGYALLTSILLSMSLVYACSYTPYEVENTIKGIPRGSIIVHESLATLLPFNYYLRGTFDENYIYSNLSEMQLRAIGGDAIDARQIISALPEGKFYYIEVGTPLNNTKFVKDYNGIRLWENENATA